MMKTKRKTKQQRLLIGVSLLVILSLCIIYWKIYSPFPTASDRDYQEIKNEGVLQIITDYSQTGYHVSGDSLAGFNYSILQILQAHTDLKIETNLETNYLKAVAKLKNGACDVLMYNAPITTELDKDLIYTTPIAQSKQVLVQRKQAYNNKTAPLRSLLNLAKKTIHIPQGSPIALRIQNISNEIGDTIFIAENKLYGIEQLILEVAAGDIDYVFCDEYVAKKMAEEVPEIDYQTVVGFTHMEGWIVRKKSTILLDSLNSWIAQIKTTANYHQLYKKYY